MQSHGIACDVEVRVANRARQPLGKFSISESLLEGTHLSFQLDAEDGRGIGLGDPVSISLSPSGDHDQRGELLLWCCGLAVEDTMGRLGMRVEAADPLTLCSGAPQFRSYAGKVPLLRLASTVLSVHPGSLERFAIADESPTLQPEWLLQCDEPGAKFLRRVAGSAGQVLYWDGERLACATIGSPPNSESVKLQPGTNLEHLACHRHPDLATGRVSWTDPESRATLSLPFAGRMPRGSAATPGLNTRAVTMSRPSALAMAGSGVALPAGDWIRATTGCTALRLGSQVEIPDGRRFVVAAIEHLFESHDRYRNHLIAVGVSRWGIGETLGGPGLLGPFQAEVTHNDDPLGLGRVRVRLCEDPERRPTPWLPWPSPASGPETGFHWLPEVGSLVSVVAPAACPEAMQGAGSLRGRDQAVASDWRSPKNAIKALAVRGGVRILMDDDRRILRLETEKAAIEVDGQGRIALRGVLVEVDGRQLVSIDGSRINLG